MINENILKNDLFVNVHKEHFEDYQTGGKGTYYSQKDVFDCIDNQPKIGGWIPCSERLPKKSGEYVVMISGAELPTCLNFLSSDNSWFDTEKDYEVLYWQPLPEAYHG